MTFGFSVHQHLSIHAASFTTNLACDHRPVAFLVIKRKGETLTASDVVKRVVAYEPRIPLGRAHFPLKGVHAVLCVVQPVFQGRPVFEVSPEKVFQIGSVRAL